MEAWEAFTAVYAKLSITPFTYTVNISKLHKHRKEVSILQEAYTWYCKRP